MINIATHFGQAAAKVSGQERGSLKSILTELQGLRVSYVAGGSAGSGNLVPAVTITANDSLVAVAHIKDSGSFEMATLANCSLAAGSTDNFINTDDLSGGDCLVFWFDCDNTS